jgi:rhamnosyltransferase subunit B
MIQADPPQRIVLATIGSLGDLHPMIALGLELKRRGHQITIASIEHYRGRVEALGFGFRPLRPDWDPTNRELIAQCEDLKSGPEVLFRQMVLPNLRETYEDLLTAVSEADLLIAGELVLAAPLVAEKLGLRWASVILSPTSFFSAHDPSLLVNVPGLYRLRRAGWLINRAILNFGRLAAQRWWEPMRRLRRELGLRVACDPVFRDKFAPELVLALFSSTLASQQPDWPRQTVQPGFIFYDRQATSDEDDDCPALAEFLASGEPPIVFTLGSTAVHNPGNFYEAGIAAAHQSGRRAILIGANDPAETLAPGILSLPYAPFSRIFPHAAVIVHQGGSGTTGQALRAGRPQLIVPYGWDQPDNGARVARLGAGLCLERSRYSAETAAAALRLLLQEKQFAAAASAAQQRMQGEDALTAACNAIEQVFGGLRSRKG